MTTPGARCRTVHRALRMESFTPSVSDCAAKQTVATIVPSLRYRNALAAIEWLCRALGFEQRVVYAGEDGVVHHAQLTFGNGVIMAGSVDNTNEWGRRIAHPD